MRLEQLSAARNAATLCVASSMHLSRKSCRAQASGTDACQDCSLRNIAMAYVVTDLFAMPGTHCQGSEVSGLQ